MLTLWCAPNSISVAVAIALQEAGADWTPVILSLATAAQTKPEYLRINPKGRVPALDTGAGILTETAAILDWIAARFPEKGMMPTDAMAAARVRELMTYLASTMHVNHAHKMRGHRWATRAESFADMQEKVPETMAASAAHVEASCPLDPFALGARMTVADPYLFTVCTWLEGDRVDIARYPKLARFFDMMSARPSVAFVRDLGLL